MQGSRKHGISFEEATTVFDDVNAKYSFDNSHSDDDEDCFIVIGMSKRLNVLVVCHCYRTAEHIRIISARRATKTEYQQYTEGE